MTGSGSMSSSSTAVPTWRINGKTNPQELPQASQPPVEMEEDRSQHEAQKAPPEDQQAAHYRQIEIEADAMDGSDHLVAEPPYNEDAKPSPYGMASSHGMEGMIQN